VKIFISHNAKDKPTARLLAGLFADRVISFWFDEYEIKPGESIVGGIGKGIEECDVFILMWSAPRHSRRMDRSCLDRVAH